MFIPDSEKETFVYFDHKDATPIDPDTIVPDKPLTEKEIKAREAEANEYSEKIRQEYYLQEFQLDENNNVRFVPEEERGPPAEGEGVSKVFRGI